MSRFPDLEQPLRGTVAEVRLAAERDIPEVLIAHQDDAELHVRLGMRRPPSASELGSRVEGSAIERRSGSGVWLTIVSPDVAPPDRCSGQLDVIAVDWDHGRAELAVWVVPQQRGRGLASGALALVGRWLLSECGLSRVALAAPPDQEAILRAASRAGYEREGVLRSYVARRGGRLDLVVMSMVAGDLPATAASPAGARQTG
ncbi:MAG: GNAT family N-acetyltransferase [Solirubrobacteraceae bacterium]